VNVAPSISPQDQVAYYRERAREALAQADLAEDAGRSELHESFLRMARSWHAAAAEIEQRWAKAREPGCEMWDISGGRVRRVA